MPDCDLQADARLLFEAVAEAGALALALFRTPLRTWAKADGSTVTEADLSIDRQLAAALRPARPGYGWLSEESPDDGSRGRAQLSWIVDPIDGTRAFSRGEPDWCIAAALVRHGRPVVAAVLAPALDEFFTALAGSGARLGETQLRASDGPALAGATISGNRKALALLADAAIASPPPSLPLQLRLASVASGRLDGCLSTGPRMDWDLAAGDLLVREAGGRVTDTAGFELVYNRPEPWQQGLVAAGARRHATLLDAARRA